MKYGIRNRLFVVLFFYCLGTMISVSLDSDSCWGSAKGTEEPVLSLDIKNKVLKQIFEDIYSKTGYQIILDKEFEKERITIKVDEVPLFEAVRKIIKRTGIKNCAVIKDEFNSTFEILNFGGKAPGKNNFIIDSEEDLDGVSLTDQEIKALHEKQKREIKMQANDPNELVILASGDQPALTRGQLNALHEQQQRDFKVANQNMDEIVVPGSGDEPGLTRGQLQALHEKQKREIEKQPSDLDEIAIPASGDQPALTRGQLNALHEQQQRDFEAANQNMDEIVVPGSGDEPGLTRGQLQALHEKQKREMEMKANDPNAITSSPE